MKITFLEKLGSKTIDLLVLGLFEGDELPNKISEIDAKLKTNIKQLISEKQIKTEFNSTYIFPTLGISSAKMIAIIGLGKNPDLTEEKSRLVGGTVIQLARQSRATSVTIVTDELNTTALTEGLYLGNYQFKEYKTDTENEESRIENIYIITAQKTRDHTIKRAEIICNAVNFARDLVNRPASQVYPKVLAGEAEKIAQESGGLIKATIISKAELKKMGANAILAVASGSEHEPYLIHLQYSPFPIPHSAKAVAIVGKGVTFDSGGLSLKPGEALEDMKSDMSGAAAVLGVFQALSTIKPNIIVHGIIPAVENMLSDKSMRVGDVIKTLSGKTVEVLNTDAEGRLILADALTYAEKQKPNTIIDLATLTGACIVALGERYSGVMGDKSVVDELLIASQNSGEKIWELPLPEEYKEKMKSEVADLSNVHKGRAAGAIMGGLFLKEFVATTPWAHIDIAGPSYNRTPLNSYTPSGASGAGVRLMLEWLLINSKSQAPNSK